MYILRPRGKKSKDQPGIKSADVEGGMSEVSTRGDLVYKATGLLLLIITFGPLQCFKK